MFVRCSLTLGLLFAVSCLQPVQIMASRPFPECDADPTCTINECPELPDPCNGIIVPKFDYPCGCCDVCVTHLEEGATCPTRSTASPPNKMCGPGLTCDRETKKCSKFNTTCALKQAQAEAEAEENPNPYKPECDDLGKFVGRQCVSGSVCYCVTEEGERIQGEALEANSGDMDCQCSRDLLKIKTILGDLLAPDADLPLCLTNGNYDPLQCATTSGTCYCVGNATDAWPNSAPVSEEFYHLLPCYDDKLHQDLPRNKPCTKEYREYMENLLGGIIPSGSPPACAIDGGYLAIQYRLDQKVCVDPEGKQVEDFAVGSETTAGREMNCHCARARYWASTDMGYMPICCPNGNYVPWQCNGPTCTCVDLATGQPYGPTVDESEKDKLQCFNTDPCHDRD